MRHLLHTNVLKCLQLLVSLFSFERILEFLRIRCETAERVVGPYLTGEPCRAAEPEV